MSVSSIFTPTNTSTTASPSLRYVKRWIMPASRKYSARSPRIANEVGELLDIFADEPGASPAT